MPKSQAGCWNTNKHFIFKNTNATIKVKSKGNFITPKRLEVKEDYSNYSQAPTPVPEYRKKSCVNNITIKIEGDKKAGLKDRGQDSFRLSNKGKAINKSAITVKDDKLQVSKKTHKDFKNLQ